MVKSEVFQVLTLAYVRLPCMIQSDTVYLMDLLGESAESTMIVALT